MSNDLILRAWDKKARKMREVDSIAFYNLKGVGDCSNSKLPKVVNLWGFNIITQQDMIIHREIKEVELMTYSGKDDVKGVKIFDGDIIKLSNGAIGFVVKEELTYTVHFSLKDKTRRWALAMYQIEELEVIGNIYENSEVMPA